MIVRDGTYFFCKKEVCAASASDTCMSSERVLGNLYLNSLQPVYIIGYLSSLIMT